VTPAGARVTVRRALLCGLALAFTAAPGYVRAADPPTLRIGSKAFTESVVLAEIAADLVRAEGIAVEQRVGLGGSRVLWDALRSGAIDVYPEYTGTLLDEVFAGVDDAFAGEDRTGRSPTDARSWLAIELAGRGIGMTEPLGFNNTYAIGMTAARARALGVATISDLRAHPELRFGFSNEFMSRHDGWPALRRRYGLPPTEVQGLDHDLAYRALTSGAIDATDLYTTDAEIRRYDLVALRDDLAFFRRYDAIFLYRKDVVTRLGPAAVRALERLSGRIDEATIISLNARAKLDRAPQSEIAADFVRTRLGVAVTPAAPTPARALLHRVGEHLFLVGISLFAAILLAIPLGILAAKQPRLGQVVLAAVGVVQTLPTLALLVFMIPLFGIGAVPAIVALFVYGLLPIVRNVHAGLSGIPDGLRESAEALGLSPWARLRLIELPLASPLILAGIKSAAVINVGTATLGALIGAGGLGQPIFTGIRLDDMGLILQGAIPASLLALAAQFFFELVERLLVPRGLRHHAEAEAPR
jgi:osmoprotectant transport system permease protein